MNTFANEMKRTANMTLTENGAAAYKSSLNKVLDLFALGGSYRNRSEENCIKLFKEAFEENKTLALKCLFYLRDRAEGAGERRFFRVCYHWLANNYPTIAHKNMERIPEFGRYDDLYCLTDTFVEKDFFEYLYDCLAQDLKDYKKGKPVSLLAKWLPSENASSAETKRLARLTRVALNLTSKQYRKALSALRRHIKIVESQMSQHHWNEIDFAALPSQAGLKYANAFLTRPETQERYLEFIKSKETKVNASVMYPHEIVRKIIYHNVDDDQAKVLDKYWNALPDFYGGREENAIAVVDVSGSMSGTPMNVAIGLGLYVADKSTGPFANQFITFSEEPEIITIEKEMNIVKKVYQMESSHWGFNTNIEAVFVLLLHIALRDNVKKEDMPKRLYIFSDMEFDEATEVSKDKFKETLFEKIKRDWAELGYELPKLIFWNLDARQNNFPIIDDDVSFVSGFSPAMIDAILGNKTGTELMLEKLNSKRYDCIEI